LNTVSIQVLQRAFSILDILALREAGLAELAQITGIQKTTLHNILKTLVELGAVKRTSGGRYAIGAKITELGEPEFRRVSLQPLAQRIANDLTSQIGESVVISVLRGAERFVIAYTDGPQELTVRLDLSERRSPYNASTGRVLLAYLTEVERERVIDLRGLPGEEWRAISSREELIVALDEIRRAGLALLLHTHQEVQTLAAPVLGPDGRAYAAVGVRMPASRFLNGRREVVIEGVRGAAAKMSELIGFQATAVGV
jgi:DNA-binding IclR family transcriptional regulator